MYKYHKPQKFSINCCEVISYTHFAGVDFSDYVHQVPHKETDNETVIEGSDVLSIMRLFHS